MVSYTQEITLDINTNTAYQVVSAKQGDTGSRWILVHLTKDNIPYQATPGNNAQFRCRKPDGHAVINPAVINNDGTITVELTAQCLAYPGRAYADVVESDADGNVLSSVSFIVLIMAAPDVASTATSSDEFQKLNELVSRSDELISEAEAWARGTKNNQDIGTGNYEEDTNVTAANFNNKKAHLYIKVNDTYVALDPSATFDSSETYYGLSAGSDNNAKYFAEQAEEAKSAIEDLTVSSTTLAAGASASAIKTVDQQTGIVNIEFGIPQGIQGIPGQDGIDGERGPSTVWVGATAPSDPDYTVWLNPEGTETPLLVTANQVSYASSTTYSANTIGYAMTSVEESMGYINTVASEAEAAANRAEAAASAIESRISDIDNKINNPVLTTNKGFLVANIINPGTPIAKQEEMWQEKISYNNDLDLTSLPKLNGYVLKGNVSLNDIVAAPRNPFTSDGRYYNKPTNGIGSNDLADEVNNSLNLADSAVQVIRMNNIDFEPSTGLVNLGTILTADDNANVNKNYLDNPWFTINQRGIFAYNGSSGNTALSGTYICDRWKIIEDEGLGNRTINLADGNVYISAATTSSSTISFRFGQVIDDDAWKTLSGRDVTASINFSIDGTSFLTKHFDFTCPTYGQTTTTTHTYQIIDDSGWGLEIEVRTINSKVHLVFNILWAGNAWGPVVEDSAIYIKKTKLELGLISTLDLEGAPLYNEELNKCQRYFRYYGGKSSDDSQIIIVGQGIAATNSEIDWCIPLHKDMVSNPVITSSVDLIASRGFTSTVASVGALSSATLASSSVIEGIDGFYLQTVATNLTQSAAYYIVLPSSTLPSEGDEIIAYLELSAEP